MTPEQIERLRLLLGRYPTVWHAGRTVGRTIYIGDGPDDMVGIMDTRQLAELVVLAHEFARDVLYQED